MENRQYTIDATGRKVYNVTRNLTTRIFRVRKQFCTLTDFDIFVCIVTSLIAMYAIEITNSGDTFWFDIFPVDPGGYIGAGVLVMLLLTEFNRVYPQGDLYQVYKGLLANHHYSATSSHPDNYWVPPNAGYYPGKAAQEFRKKFLSE